MLFSAPTSTATYADWADVLKRFLNLQRDPKEALFTVISDWTRAETTGTLIMVGIIFCFILGFGLIVVSVSKLCYFSVKRTCSWVCRRNPWARLHELERREKAVELEEALVVRQARTLALDVEIGVCKRLLEVLRHSVTSAEDREFELEKDKEALLEEVLREEIDVFEMDNSFVRRRLPTMEPEE
ncbi:hypothetical protein F5878DRAFT_664703 [Lentinula raphanica]|uniref:Uncharacterized protein n=1 Tax=Lentinula raphanica TaxID=153919 RepID=A0AA38P1E6_9AGAR|nr:hypothetical protein F5878DRAFT_664703 [Lentinula raphanica]